MIRIERVRADAGAEITAVDNRCDIAVQAVMTAHLIGRRYGSSPYRRGRALRDGLPLNGGRTG